MGICGGSSSPGISVVSNKYTINVENDEKKQIKNESNTKTINQNNNNNNKLIQANSTSSNNKNEEIIKNQEYFLFLQDLVVYYNFSIFSKLLIKK